MAGNMECFQHSNRRANLDFIEDSLPQILGVLMAQDRLLIWLKYGLEGIILNLHNI